MSISFLPSAFAQQDPEPDDYVHWSDLVSGQSKLKLYGYVRLDGQYDDSRFNDPQIPGYVRSEDANPPLGVPAGVVASEDNAEYSLHARLTRIGAELGGTNVDGLGDPGVSGRIEIDFYNSGLNDADSRNALRMRRAYLKLDWERWSLLAGQEWDLISPLYPAVNSDLVMWGAGNTGDRRPQVRAEYSAPLDGGAIAATFGVGLSGAVSSSTVLGGLRSGENSAQPMLAARVGYKSDGGFSVGVWGHDAKDEVDAAVNGQTSFDSNSVGIDLHVPLAGKSTWLKGEYWSGQDLDDIRGGIFQGINASGGEISAEGGFLELGHKLSPHLTASVGYSFDDPDDKDLDPFMRSKNDVAYGTLVWNYGATRFGFEYLNWKTEYVDLADGDANRLVAWIAFSF